MFFLFTMILYFQRSLQFIQNILGKYFSSQSPMNARGWIQKPTDNFSIGLEVVLTT